MTGESKSIGFRSACLALLAGCALMLTISSRPAAAHKQRFETKLQLRLTDLSETVTQFSGNVTSPKGACLGGRKVKVFVHGVLFGVTTSSASGLWTLTAGKPPEGTVVLAITPRKVLSKRRGHLHKCGTSGFVSPGP